MDSIEDTGCVGHGFCHAAFANVGGIATSSYAQSDSPLARSRIHMYPVFEVCSMAGMPFQLSSTVGCGPSKSQRSWWVSWKNHCNSPLVASSATILAEYRFVPARLPPQNVLSALPVLKYTILRVGSKVGVPQTDAPPCCQLVPAHVAGSVV